MKFRIKHMRRYHSFGDYEVWMPQRRIFYFWIDLSYIGRSSEAKAVEWIEDYKKKKKTVIKIIPVS